jgi:D-3-phosphoglycerate dehydrogenase
VEKVTGIGGIFFKSADPKVLSEWYKKHLGIDLGEYHYTSFKWNNANPETPGQTVFSIDGPGSTHFAPSDKLFMINFRVSDLDSLITELKQSGVTVVGETVSYDYGKFGWIMDPEGNKIELWEPVD